MEGLQIQKNDLINDLISVTSVMEDLWRFHPNNPNQEDVVAEYALLQKMESIIENEIKTLK
jgi:hypothetical protein|tara:strand:- start:766 stop:948 length:183 start_codon:yes stop_codon:yes gene_type:complete